MDTKELSQKLDRIQRLENVLLEDPKTVGVKLVTVMGYNHLVDSLPDVFSYQDLRALHGYLADKVSGNAVIEKEKTERKKQFLKELKGICSPSAYHHLESKLNDL